MFGRLFQRNGKKENSASSETSLIDLRNVVKAYDTAAGQFLALNGVDMTVSPGSFVSVVGKSGSGKSTLTNMITGIDPDFAVINLQSRQAGHHMFHHFHSGVARLERCAARDLNTIGHNCLDTMAWPEIGAHEDNPRSRRCRSKLDPHVQSAPIAKAFYRDRFGNRVLLTQ